MGCHDDHSTKRQIRVFLFFLRGVLCVVYACVRVDLEILFYFFRITKYVRTSLLLSLFSFLYNILWLCAFFIVFL
jgi:hypothetical protein